MDICGPNGRSLQLWWYGSLFSPLELKILEGVSLHGLFMWVRFGRDLVFLEHALGIWVKMLDSV